MGTWSQNVGLVGEFADYAKKYGIKSAKDIESEEVRRKMGEQYSDQGNVEQLKQAYEQDRINQEGYDKLPEVRAARQLKEFQEKAPQMQERMQSQAESEAKRGLAENLAGVKQGASRRGLLYSGIRQGAEGALRAQSAGQLAQQKADINTSIQNQIDQMRSGAAGAGFQAYQGAVQQAQNDYNMAMQKYKQKQGQLSAIGGALGMGAGLALSAGNPAGAMVGQSVGSQLL